jgi:anti-sigma-K factor RskA
MNDIHALSGAYAVDALDDLERARFEQHLAECETCRDEVASLREAATQLGAAVAVPPPPALRDRVLADISTVRPLPPLAGATTAPAKRVRRRAPLLAAAAAVLVAIGGGVAIEQPWHHETRQSVSLSDQVLQAHDATRQSVTIRGGTATLVRSKTLHRAVLVAEDLPSAPTGKTYELWLQDPSGTMVPAGLMPSAQNQNFLLTGDAARAIAAGLTIEPEGGSQQPHLPPVALFDFKETA